MENIKTSTNLDGSTGDSIGSITPSSTNFSDEIYAEIIIPGNSLARLFSRPFLLIPNPGTNVVIEFVDAIFIYKFGTAPMTDGGNIFISYLGFQTLSVPVSAITLMGEESDKVVQMQLGSTADMALPPDYGLYLQMTDCDFTQGASTSSARIHLVYRLHTIL